MLKVNSDGYCSVKESEEPLLKPYAFFPNPVDDQLHLEFSPDVTPSVVELYDIQGRLVRSQGKGLENIVMDDGTSYSDKVVKQ